MMTTPMQNLAQALRQNGLVRFMAQYAKEFADTHLKDLVVDAMGPNREMRVQGREVVNFGSDSFLGLDQDARVREAIRRGVEQWGTHNGASRAFASVRANEAAEEKLARWLGAEDVLIYPSVTLANLGALPGLVGRRDLLVVDEHAHNSIQEGAKIAQANGARLARFSHCDPADLERVLRSCSPFRVAVVAIDGVYSMTGAQPPLVELNQICLRHNAVLYVDDAHATAVMGRNGRGTVLDTLGSYTNTLVVGSLSKGFSCLGSYIACTPDFKWLLKIRSNTFIFGGPVPPPYLEAICVVCDILSSQEYDILFARLQANLHRLIEGIQRIGLAIHGGEHPIVSVLVGDEEATLKSGSFLFDQGYYVQSVTFPAVPYHAGVLRIQVNANHIPEAIDGLVEALAALRERTPLPGPDSLHLHAA